MQIEAEEAVEIELEQEQPEETKKAQEDVVVEDSVKTEEAESDDKEIANYSESVKKRINKLTYKIREA